MTSLVLPQPRDDHATASVSKSLRPRVSLSVVDNKENLAPSTRPPRRVSSALFEQNRAKETIVKGSKDPSERAVLVPSDFHPQAHRQKDVANEPKVLASMPRNVSFSTPLSTTTSRKSHTPQPSKQPLSTKAHTPSAIRRQQAPSLPPDSVSNHIQTHSLTSTNRTYRPSEKGKQESHVASHPTTSLEPPSLGFIPSETISYSPANVKRKASQSDLRSRDSGIALALPASSHVHSAFSLNPASNPLDIHSTQEGSFARARAVARARDIIPPITTISPSAPSSTFNAGSMFVADIPSSSEPHRLHVPPPLTTTGLLSRKHTTQHGEIEVLPGEMGILLDLRTSERRAGRPGNEILRISSDGGNVSADRLESDEADN